MKRSLLLFVFVLIFAGCAGAAPAAVPTAAPPTATPVPAPEGFRTFVVVPAETTASYLMDEEFLPSALSKYNIDAGKKVTVGSTQAVEGSLSLELGADQPLGPNRFAVDLLSLTSDQSLRDGWLKDNALESNKFPEAVFVASSIQGAPAEYTDGAEVQFQLVGDLTVRDVILPVTFDVTATLSGDTIRGVAEAQAKLTDFGITPPNFANTLVVEDLFTIRIELTAKEQ